MDEWLRSVKSSLRPKTWEQYRQITHHYILPTLGTIRLKDLRPNQVQALYTAKLEEGKSRNTVRLIHAVVHRSLEQAVTWGLIGRNPAHAVNRPKPKRKELKVWNDSQVRSFLSAVEGHRFAALFYLAVTTGLREGELLGLRWSDLDWVTGQLQIQRQLHREPGHGLVFSEPKTSAGRRVVVLGQGALDNLRAHFQLQQKERQFAGDRWQEQDLIFPSSIGTPMEPRNMYRYFIEVVKEIGLPKIRFHDLRHSAATLMLQQGIHPKIVQERLGHSTISMTLDTYSHVIPAMQQEAASKMDELLNPVAVKLQ